MATNGGPHIPRTFYWTITLSCSRFGSSRSKRKCQHTSNTQLEMVLQSINGKSQKSKVSMHNLHMISKGKNPKIFRLDWRTGSQQLKLEQLKQHQKWQMRLMKQEKRQRKIPEMNWQKIFNLFIRLILTNL